MIREKELSQFVNNIYNAEKEGAYSVYQMIDLMLSVYNDYIKELYLPNSIYEKFKEALEFHITRYLKADIKIDERDFYYRVVSINRSGSEFIHISIDYDE